MLDGALGYFISRTFQRSHRNPEFPCRRQPASFPSPGRGDRGPPWRHTTGPSHLPGSRSLAAGHPGRPPRPQGQGHSVCISLVTEKVESGSQFFRSSVASANSDGILAISPSATEQLDTGLQLARTQRSTAGGRVGSSPGTRKQLRAMLALVRSPRPPSKPGKLREPGRDPA